MQPKDNALFQLFHDLATLIQSVTQYCSVQSATASIAIKSGTSLRYLLHMNAPKCSCHHEQYHTNYLYTLGATPSRMLTSQQDLFVVALPSNERFLAKTPVFRTFGRPPRQ